MTMLEQLSKLSSVEEFFHLLDVPYDPAILNVARLHILRRMGEYLKHAPATPEEETARAYFRAHLLRACDDFAQSSPLDQRVFKVLQDAVRVKHRPLISLAVPRKGQSSSAI
jgi:nitrogenase-stabilizing/protective protein